MVSKFQNDVHHPQTTPDKKFLKAISEESQKMDGWQMHKTDSKVLPHSEWDNKCQKMIFIFHQC